MEPQEQAANRPLPPVETRFQPGKSGNPNGRPKGADARAALARILAKGRQNDTDAESEDEQLGDGARKAAADLWDAAVAGDIKRVKALVEMFNQALGKPKEFIEHTGSTTLVLSLGDAAPTEPPT